MQSSRLIIILLTVLITSVALAVSKTSPGKSNGRIAFVSNRENIERIYTMNPDGSGRTKLTNGPHQLQPSWSPDGTKIAYMNRLNDATALAGVVAGWERDRVRRNSLVAIHDRDDRRGRQRWQQVAFTCDWP